MDSRAWNRVVVAVLAMLPGCSLTSDHFSCSVSTNGKRVRCVDYENVAVAFRATVETLCRGIGGEFSITDTCPQQGKIGGCREEASGYAQTAWYYPDSIAMTPQEVQGRCSGKSYFVDPSGARPADMSMAPAGDGGQCSGSSITSVNLTFQNNTSGPVSGYWVDPSCKETFYFKVDSGNSYVQQTFSTHVWRIRVGDMNSIGMLRKEAVAGVASETIPIN